MSKVHRDCATGCQYAKDVGMEPMYQCAYRCYYAVNEPKWYTPILKWFQGLCR